MRRSTWPADAGIALMVGVLFWASGVWSSGQALALGAAQILPLVARRRAPESVLAIVTTATVAHVLLGLSMNIGYVPVLIGLYSASGSRWLCAGAATAVALAMATVKGPVNGGLLAVAISVVAWTLGVERQRHLADRAQLERYRRELTAMRLHDTLGQTTTVMLVQAEALKAVGQLAEADRRRVDAILAAGREAMTVVRRTLQQLQDDSLDEPDFAALLDRLKSAGLVVGKMPSLTRLPRPARTMAERVISEALTNVLRHAGPGVPATVDVRFSRDNVDIQIRNRLPGTAPRPGAGFGLSSLDRQLAGRLEYGRKGGYWVVHAVVPLTFPDTSTGLTR